MQDRGPTPASLQTVRDEIDDFSLVVLGHNRSNPRPGKPLPLDLLDEVAHQLDERKIRAAKREKRKQFAGALWLLVAGAAFTAIWEKIGWAIHQLLTLLPPL